MSRLVKSNRALSCHVLLSGLLAVSIALTGPAAFAAKQNRAAKDFLPPVASINPKIDSTTPENPDDLEEVVSLPAVNSPILHTTPKPNRIEGSLRKQYLSEDLEVVRDLQLKADEADLEKLWAATVEKNPVIRFSLEKIAMPADLQDSHSSQFLKKGLSMMITGATLAGQMLPGGSGYQNMAVGALGQGLQNIVTGRTQPSGVQLSDTEKIQMAKLIEELKIKLIQNYQNYKNTLQTLASSHQQTVANNNLYSKALASKDDLAIMAASSAYYKALKSETVLKQQAKMYRLQLERLAGEQPVKDLALAIRIPDGSTDTAALNPAAAPAVQPTKQPEPIGPEPLIGPELPEPMEIGPSLGRPTSALPTQEPIVKLPEIQTGRLSYEPPKPAPHAQEADLLDFAPLDDKVMGGNW